MIRIAGMVRTASTQAEALAADLGRRRERIGSSNVERRSTSRRARQVAVALAVASVGSAQFAGSSPASAVTGIQKTTALSVSNSDSPKTVTAFCPTGKRVIGGGGWAITVSAAESSRVTLTQLEPIHPVLPGLDDRYVASGAETAPGVTGNWSLQAYAICADPGGLSGYGIRSSASLLSSDAARDATVGCLDGKVVLGTGGRIDNPGGPNPAGEVVLQVARASATGDIARVRAHEDASGYAGSWGVSVYAVCVDRPFGYEVVSAPSAKQVSESEKGAYVTCPGSKRVHGAGAAIANTASGSVSLQVVYPYENLRTVEAFAVENTPTSENWDYILAQAICAY